MINELKPFENIIIRNADKVSLDPLLIGAIIMQESAGHIWTARHEPNVKYSYMPQTYSKALNISLDTELAFQKTSWGLMQLMGFKAREIGFDAFLPQLLLPSVNIEYGCKAMSLFCNKYPKLNDAIASYNAGSPRYLASGKYVNQNYVDGVNKWLTLVK